MKKILIIIIFFLIPKISFGATLYFSESKEDNFIKVDLLIDRQGKDINAIESEILFDPKVISIENILYGNSPITFWVEKPSQIGEGVIKFSGIVPNGLFNGQEIILSLLFSSKTEGMTNLNLKNAIVLENDGKATPVSVFLKPITISLLKTSENYYIEDHIPPDDFSIVVSTSSAIFDGKYFISFLAQDKESGILKYEIKEGFFGDFKEGESPYLLSDQSLRKKIYVKAYDKNANIKISTADAIYPLLTYKNIILVVIMVLIVYGLWKIKKKHS